MSDFCQEEKLHCFRLVIASFQQLLALYLTDPCGLLLLQHGHHAGSAITRKRCHVEDDNSTWVAHKQAENLQRMEIMTTWDCKNMENEKTLCFLGKHDVFLGTCDFKGFGGSWYIYGRYLLHGHSWGKTSSVYLWDWWATLSWPDHADVRDLPLFQVKIRPEEIRQDLHTQMSVSHRT